MKKQTEGQLQDDIRLVLNHPDAVWWRNNVGSAQVDGRGYIKFGVGNPGGSDLVGVFRGRAVFAEIKTPLGRLSADQQTFQRLVERKGAIYVVLRSTYDAADLLADLEQRFPREQGAQ